jgi:hypothetical protein
VSKGARKPVDSGNRKDALKDALMTGNPELTTDH